MKVSSASGKGGAGKTSVAVIHGLERVISPASHFEIPIAVCANKYDINEEIGPRDRKILCKQIIARSRQSTV